MKGSTHLIGGLIAYFLYLIVTTSLFSLSAFLVAMLFALLPDIDTPRSTISNISPVTQTISKKINIIAGHRGPLHSLFFRSVITLLLRYLYASSYIEYTVFIAGSLGYLSHLILDAFTPRGIPFFWPMVDKSYTICKRRGLRSSLCVKTGSTKEDAVAILMTFILFFLAGVYLGIY